MGPSLSNQLTDIGSTCWDLNGSYRMEAGPQKDDIWFGKSKEKAAKLWRNHCFPYYLLLKLGLPLSLLTSLHEYIWVPNCSPVQAPVVSESYQNYNGAIHDHEMSNQLTDIGSAEIWMGQAEWELAHKGIIFGLENQKKQPNYYDKIIVSCTTKLWLS